jgi:sterol desaturase/sphingolipid hydroxylase (fatty acid hydroxylase superfamily)
MVATTVAPEQRDLRRARRAAVALLAVAVALTVVTRPQVFVGLALLAVLIVPIERVLPLRRQRILRPGLVTDLTHLLLNTVPVAIATVALVVAAALPFVPLRAIDIEASLPGSLSVVLAAAVVMLGSYGGHRLMHAVPFLWRFHAVHHSIEHMDWLAAARLHPLDAAFTQACFLLPLFALGYDPGLFAGIAVFVTALGIFQHANVRLRFPFVRWVLPTPEWHHWHHATDPDAHDTNFGLPFVDRLFGTAHMPRDRRPDGFGVPDPVPDGWVGQLKYSFTRAAR